jgi:hypothetical protein
MFAYMDEQQTRERIVALKSEIASLRHTDAAYRTKHHRTQMESNQHIRRLERMQQILDELATLTRRTHPKD